MSTFRELFHLPTCLANFSRVISSANFSCQLFESYFTCQLLMPTFRELLHLPTSHASFSRVTSPANFSCQLFGCYLIILKTQANFFFSTFTSRLLILLLFMAGVGPTGAYETYPLRRSCVSKRSRRGPVRICLDRGEPSAEIVRVEALSLRRRANLS